MARRFGASLILQVFALGCGFLFAVAAARLLGPRGYGLVAVSLSVASIAAIIALLGTNGLAVREVAASAARSDWTRLRQFVRWSSLAVCGSSIIVSLVVASAALFGGAYRGVLLLGAIAVPILAGLHLLRGINQGTYRIMAAQLPLDVVRWIVTLTLMAGLIVGITEASPSRVLLIVILSYAAGLAIAVMALNRYLRALPTAPFTSAKANRWFTASLPFLTVALLGIAATELNTLALGLISGPRDAGLYQPIARIAPLLLIAKEAIDMPLAPRIAGLWESGDRDELRRLIHRSALASLAGTVVLAAAILVASPYIFAAFGSEFEAYSHFIYWIAAAQVANTIFGPSALLLAMAADMRRRMQAQAMTLVVQGILTLALVPVFGIAGAVLALSLQVVFWAAINWLLARRSTQIDTSTLSAVRAWLK